MIDNFSNDIYSANIYFFGFIPQINGKFLPSIRGLNHRSEERRVGKECRSRWSPYH